MFLKAFERLKVPSKFVDINDVSTRSEYWGTYLLISLPFFLLSAPFIIIPCFMDEIGNASKFMLIIGTFLSMIGLLAFLPVFARRLRDIGISPWFAILCIAPSIFPYVSGLTGIAMIVFGCIPGKNKESAEQSGAQSGSSPAFFWMAAVALFMLIGIRTMQSNITVVQDVFESRIENSIKKNLKNLERSFNSSSYWD